MAYKKGDIIRFERTFTEEDVRTFTNVSKDSGIHHKEPDALGRFVVQGLLTATLPTKVGGDLNVLARTMSFEFFRPVYTNDTILCEVIVNKYEVQENDRIAIATSFTCVNQEEKIVMTGEFAGVIMQG